MRPLMSETLYAVVERPEVALINDALVLVCLVTHVLMLQGSLDDRGMLNPRRSVVRTLSLPSKTIAPAPTYPASLRSCASLLSKTLVFAYPESSTAMAPAAMVRLSND